MKRLSNPAKIGDAALTVYFGNKVIIEKTSFDFENTVIDWQKVTRLYLWGIASGIVEVKVPRMFIGSAMQLLSENFDLQDLEKFSHVFTKNEINWSLKRARFQELETIKIFRFTPKNCNEIKNFHAVRLAVKSGIAF